MISSREGRIRTLALGTAALALLYPLTGSAQSGAASGTSASPGGDQEVDEQGLRDIVVTAQRRDQRLQDVPVAITAITAEMAREQGVAGNFDLPAVTPGLVISNSGQGTAVYLRGVGTQNTVVGEEASNPIYVDGILYAGINSGFFSFNSIERVEVLRGPQGTLFGRNATGGLIQVVTRTPDQTLRGEAFFGVANYQTAEAGAYVSTPVTGNLAMDVSAYYRNQGDGWGINRVNGRDVYKSREYALRSKVAWQPGVDTEVVFAADVGRSDSSGPSAFSVLEGKVGLLGFPYLGNIYDVNESLQPRMQIRNDGANLRIQHDFSFARFVSLSAVRYLKTINEADQDRIPVAFVDTTSRNFTKQYSQELQLLSRSGSNIDWIVGLYYLDLSADLRPLSLAGAAQAAAGGRIDRYAKMDTRSYAAYGQLTYPITSSTNFTVGGRYTIDERKLNSRDQFATGTIVSPISTEATFKKPTFRLALDQKLDDDILAYASFSRGFKSGIYNLFAPNVVPVSPEVLDAYEVGLKSEFLSKRVRLNVSGFYYKYNDIQLIQAFAGGSRLLNAAKATITGVDVELVARPFAGLTLNSSAEFLHGKYDSFPNAPATIPNPGSCTPFPRETGGPRTGGNLTCVIDASGFQMIRAPDYTFTVGATYARDTPIGNLSFNVNYYRTDDYPFEADGRLRQPSYDLLNAQVAWRTRDDRVGVRVWGKNLSDTQYYAALSSSVGDTGQAAAPRTYGLTVDFKY